MRQSRILQSIVYPQTTVPPPKSPKPMKVLCLGPPRSATESLAVALQKLGYTTYHGWDVVYEQPSRLRQWTLLADQKWGVSPDGDSKITQEQFDALLGHTDAVLDSIAFTFAAELLAAYPEAKVVLNYRTDIDGWHRSICRAFLPHLESWFVWFLTRFSPQLFWTYQFYNDMAYPHLFRAEREGKGFGIRNNGKWVYREHCAMVRGLMVGKEERYLEWTVQDGWDPLCKFLGKDVPSEPFPRVNDGNAFDERSKALTANCLKVALINMTILGAVVSGTVAVVLRRYDLTLQSLMPAMSWPWS